MEMADSVLEVSFEANKDIIEKLIGDDSMYEALMEIMEPRLRVRDRELVEEARREGLQEGLQRGIRGMVEALHDLGHDDEEIKTAIMRRYGLSPEETEEYL